MEKDLPDFLEIHHGVTLRLGFAALSSAAGLCVVRRARRGGVHGGASPLPRGRSTGTGGGGGVPAYHLHTVLSAAVSGDSGRQGKLDCEDTWLPQEMG